MKFKNRSHVTLIIFLIAGTCQVYAESSRIASDVILFAQSQQTKKRIFMELATLQDMGMDKESAEAKILSKYNLTYDQLVRIIQEGIEKDWLSDLDE